MLPTTLWDVDEKESLNDPWMWALRLVQYVIEGTAVVHFKEHDKKNTAAHFTTQTIRTHLLRHLPNIQYKGLGSSYGANEIQSRKTIYISLKLFQSKQSNHTNRKEPLCSCNWYFSSIIILRTYSIHAAATIIQKLGQFKWKQPKKGWIMSPDPFSNESGDYIEKKLFGGMHIIFVFALLIQSRCYRM
jgi:hypothetical protein